MSHKRSTGFRAGSRVKRVFPKVLILAAFLSLFSVLAVFYLRARDQSNSQRRELRELFENGSFESAFLKSAELLAEQPLDSFLLTIHGFSAYQLAIAQINNFDTQKYINYAIWALRRALLLRENATDARIFYVLGKAYFYKGPKFADLTIKYLEKAKETLYWAADIPEYLGLSYASIGDYRSSVAAFANALTGAGPFSAGPSDLLLLSIARSYMALEEFELAKAYLVHCLEISRDSITRQTARLLLGDVLFRIGDLHGAETEFLRVIEENGENAEASFRLGELYALEGDIIRARAEWRRAVRIDPTHGPARRRLNI